MRSVGVDISKASFAALALAVDGEPRKALTWKADNPKDSEAVKLDSFYGWLYWNLSILKPNVVAVEQVAGFHNRKVIQILSRFEGVALLAGKRHRRGKAIVLNPTVGSSRNIALGIPANSKKELAFAEIKKMYPGFDFGRANSGGMDKGDAMTHALAAPIHLERR